MTDDHSTDRFYAQNAAQYAADTERRNFGRLDAFIARLPKGARVLELGCGAGHDSAHMLSLGIEVRPTDGTAEMAAEAERRLGVPVRVQPFATLSDSAAFDAVWANACLLHVPRTELPEIIGRIARALKAGGLFYASYKTAADETIDRFGRYYNNPSAEYLQSVYEAAGLGTIEIDASSGGGYDGVPTDWLHVTATKV
ncbi:class I SAM-dependent methyltransferase [Rhizobium sp. PAMB 3182]